MPKKPLKYDVHPSVAIVQEWIEQLPAKTGKSLDQWLTYIRKKKYATVAEARAALKADHSLGTNSAWWLAERAFAKDMSLMDDDPDRYLSLAPKYVAEQYAGKKAPLLPMFESLCTVSRGLGKDVLICPCKTIVPIYREHVIAQIKPTTQTRIDFGLCLTPILKSGSTESRKLPKRLIDTGGFAKRDRITHRIEVTSEADIDDFLRNWAERAYSGR